MALRVGVAGAAATQEASCCGCSWATPASASARSPRAAPPAGRSPSCTRSCRSSPTHLRPDRAGASSPRPTWSSSRCRTASPPPWWPGSPRTCRWSTWVPTSGSPARPPGRPTTAARTPAAGPTGCPSCPAPAARSRRHPGREPRLLRHHGRPRPGAAADAALVEPADVVVVAASGTSGAGAVGQGRPARQRGDGRASSYKAGGVHQHTPEMEQSLSAAAGTAVTLSFTPVLAPMPRGILATCTARLSAGRHEAALREALHAAYDDEPFVHVLPDGTWPTTAATLGSNSVAPPGRGRPAQRPGGRGRRPRQPGQGRGRPGDPERQPGRSGWTRPPASPSTEIAP